MIHVETSYSTLLNKSFAQASKINLYVGKLYSYEIPDEKKAVSIENSNQTLNLGNHQRLFIMPFVSLNYSNVDAILKFVPNFY